MTFIDRVAQRLIKELRRCIATEHPSFTEFSEYFAPLDMRGIDEILDAEAAVNELNTLPWPETPCILYAENGSLFHFLPTTSDLPGRLDVARKEMIEAGRNISAFVIDREGLLWSFHAAVDAMTNGPVRIESGIRGGCVARRPFETGAPHDIFARMASARAELRDWVRKVFPREWERSIAIFDQAIENFCASQEPGPGEHWMFRNPDFPAGIWDYIPSLIGAFANIVTPCHYKVRATFAKEHGGKRTAFHFAHKPIFALIRYDRAYQVVSGCADCDMPPHFRHGHVRYLWLQSGINRLHLPPDPAERLQLANERKVRRVVVSPCWVGTRTTADAGMTYEVLADDA